MKKSCIVLFMVAALMIALSAYAQNTEKEAAPEAKTEQVEKKSCKEKVCCKEKGKETKPCPKEASVETKSCGKKK